MYNNILFRIILSLLMQDFILVIIKFLRDKYCIFKKFFTDIKLKLKLINNK